MSARASHEPVATGSRREAALAWGLVLPALLAIGLIAIAPIVWTLWESLHLHDLGMPWLGRPFVGIENYVEAVSDPRVWSALGHTGFFVITSVSIELLAGLLLAMTLDRLHRASGVVRTAVLLPWAIPTVVAALVWRFVFESPGGLASALMLSSGVTPPTWFADATAAWLPLIIADAWKTTPFVAVLLLAGLQNIDRALYEAAAVDGAGPWRRFTGVTLPLLKPVLLVALLFRTLDALRAFDVVYVMTGGGPGTATEPIALYTFDVLFRNLRFGFGSALSMVLFVVAFLFALVFMRAFGRDLSLEREG